MFRHGTTLVFLSTNLAAYPLCLQHAVEAVSNHLHTMPKLDGLVPCFISSSTGTFRQSSTVSVGASADSYYEYLVKQWAQTGRTRDW